MPIFAINRATAEGLYELFGRERARREAALDLEVDGLARTAMESPPVQRSASELGAAAVRVLRTGKCVHCHTGNVRPRRAFEATLAGLGRYVGKHGGLALWERLETRVLEDQAGLSAARPGMPMTSRPLPDDVRSLLLTWAHAGCPDPGGAAMCPLASKTGAP
jgi:hypothetical protein